MQIPNGVCRLHVAVSSQRQRIMFSPEFSQLPGQIEAALQFLRFAEELQRPLSFDNAPREGRALSRTELEVKDSALTVLLEYFNHPVPAPEHRHGSVPSNLFGKSENQT